jgi:hypothetical protein
MPVVVEKREIQEESGGKPFLLNSTLLMAGKQILPKFTRGEVGLKDGWNIYFRIR